MTVIRWQNQQVPAQALIDTDVRHKRLNSLALPEHRSRLRRDERAVDELLKYGVDNLTCAPMRFYTFPSYGIGMNLMTS